MSGPPASSTVASSLRVRPGAWRVGVVRAVITETASATTLVLEIPGWPGHRAGQHVDVRLTAEDGYQAERSYSIASPPGATAVSITIERLADGEVSPYLTEEVRVGDPLEVRGPLGGYFVWDTTCGGPLLLVAGGSGIVPLMAMVRHRARVLESADAAVRHALPTRLLYSSRSWDGVIYRDELARLSKADETLEVTHTLTREAPADWHGFRRRIDRMMLAHIAWPPTQRPHIFVCGPTPLVESAAASLVELGHDPARVKTERFGPTGGDASPAVNRGADHG